MYIVYIVPHLNIPNLKPFTGGVKPWTGCVDSPLIAPGPLGMHGAESVFRVGEDFTTNSTSVNEGAEAMFRVCE